MWSLLSHWVLGVPFDLILRAKRNDEAAVADMLTLLDIKSRRFLGIFDSAAHIIAGVICFILAIILSMGFYYGFELAQGMFFMAVPAAAVGVLNLRMFRHLNDNPATGGDLIALLQRHRFWVQFIGVMSICTTAMYGMYHNLTLPLGY